MYFWVIFETGAWWGRPESSSRLTFANKTFAEVKLGKFRSTLSFTIGKRKSRLIPQYYALYIHYIMLPKKNMMMMIHMYSVSNTAQDPGPSF